MVSGKAHAPRARSVILSVAMAALVAGCGASPSESLDPAEPERFDCRELLGRLEPPVGGDPVGDWDYVGGCQRSVMARLNETCEADEATYLSAPVTGWIDVNAQMLDRQTTVLDVTFEVALEDSCVQRLGGQCSASALFELEGMCQVTTGRCRCSLSAQRMGAQWGGAIYTVEGGDIRLRNLTGSREALYGFSVNGDEFVHETSRGYFYQDWYFIARRRAR